MPFVHTYPLKLTMMFLSVLLISSPLVLSQEQSSQEPAKLAQLPAQAKASIDKAIGAKAGDWSEPFEQACRLTMMEHGKLTALIKFLNSKASNLRIVQLLTRAYLQEGQVDNAYKMLKEQLGAADVSPVILGELARVTELLGEDAEALMWIEKTLKLEQEKGRRFSLLVRQIQLLYDLNRVEAAQTTIRSLINNEGHDPGPVANYCARISALCGDFKLATELFRPISKEGKALRDELVLHGTLLLKENRPLQASKAFEKALPLATGRHDQMYILSGLLTSSRQSGRLAELVDQWMKSKEDMTAIRLRALLGVLSELGRAKTALTLLTELSNSSDSKLTKLIGSNEFQREMIAIALDAGRVDEAKKVYERLIAKKPNTVYYRFGLARLLVLSSNHEEAVKLFQSAINRTSSAPYLMALADGARCLALNEVALSAAAKAGEQGDIARIQAVIFQAEFSRQQGDADKAMELILSLRGIAKNAQCAIMVADALESVERKTDALEVLKSELERSKHPDILERVIGLDEQLGNQMEAYQLWKECWENAIRPARIIQSQERVMDLAAREGKLIDLVIELEDRLIAGNCTEKELSLLVAIYSNSGDPVSAVGMISLFYRDNSDPVEMLERMSRVYYECEMFGRSYAVLRQLAKINPDKAEEYLQQIAVLALERKQNRDALLAIDSLRSLRGQEISEEFCAGIIAMMGKHQQAATEYRKSLARHPNHIENYLLWAEEMRQIEQRSKAQQIQQQSRTCNVFNVLAETALGDDLFAIAIDGLLNLGAPEVKLRSALRRIRERIALKPDKIYLYRLAADIHEEMQQMAEAQRVVELSLVSAGMRRGAILQELMNAANVSECDEDVIRYGSILLSVIEHVPPRVCIQVAKGSLAVGNIGAAGRAFRRAAVHGDTALVMRQAAQAYEENGMDIRAWRVLAELLVTEPDDVALCVQMAGVLERQAKKNAARKLYFKTLKLLIGRKPAVAGQEIAHKSKRRRRAVFTYSDDELKQYQGEILAGLCRLTVKNEDRQALRQWLDRQLDEELQVLKEGKLIQNTLKENPRLYHIASIMSKIGPIILRSQEVLKKGWAKLVKVYPADERLKKDMARFNDSKFRWRADTDESTLKAYILDPGTKRQKLVSELPRLIMTGHHDLARDALKSLFAELTGDRKKVFARALQNESRRPKVPRLKGMRLKGIRSSHSYLRKKPRHWPFHADLNVLATAVALNDKKLIDDYCRILPEACQYYIALAFRDRSGLTYLEPMQSAINAAWPHMDSKARQSLNQALRDLPKKTQKDTKAQVEVMRLLLAIDKTPVLDDLLPIKKGLLLLRRKHRSNRLRNNDEFKVFEYFFRLIRIIVNNAPEEDKVNVIKTALDTSPVSSPHKVIMEIALGLEKPANDTLCQAISQLYKQLPLEKKLFQHDESIYSLRSKMLALTTSQPKLALLLGQTIWDKYHNSAGPIITWAFLLPRDDLRTQQETEKLLDQCVNKCIAEAKQKVDKRFTSYRSNDSKNHPVVLALLAGQTLPPRRIDQAWSKLRKQAEASDTPEVILTVGVYLLFGAERRKEAFGLAQEIVERFPDSEKARKVYLHVAWASCGIRSVTEFFSEHLPSAAKPYRYGWSDLAWAYLDLYHPDQALEATGHLGYEDPYYRSADSIRAAIMQGDRNRIRQEMVRYATLAPSGRTEFRKDAYYRPELWPAGESLGGLNGCFPSSLGIKLVFMPVGRKISGMGMDLLTFYRFGAESSIRKYIRRFSFSRKVIDEPLQESIAESTMNPEDCLSIIKTLVDDNNKGISDAIDRMVLANIAKKNPNAIPVELQSVIDQLIYLTNPNDLSTLSALADVKRLHGQREEALVIMNSVVAWDAVCNGNAEYLDAWLTLCEPDQRQSNAQRILFAGRPSPIGKRAPQSSRLREVGRYCNASTQDDELVAVLACRDPGKGRESKRKFINKIKQTHLNNTIVATDSRYDLACFAAVTGKRELFRRLTSEILTGLSPMFITLSSGLAANSLKFYATNPSRSKEPFLPDLRLLLPSGKELKHPDDYVDIIIEELGKLREKRIINRSDYVASLCLLGQCCVDKQMTDKAMAIYNQVNKRVEDLPAAQLWVADLARLVGRKNRAAEIELTLLKKSLLPILRVENLLNEVEAASGQAEADRLAGEVATYSQLPAIVKRAARHNQR